MNAPSLQRTTFRTNRLLEFCSQRELVAQTGQAVETWPLVVLKELVDNGLDAIEEAGGQTSISVSVSTRRSASSAEPAWTVDSEPS